MLVWEPVVLAPPRPSWRRRPPALAAVLGALLVVVTAVGLAEGMVDGCAGCSAAGRAEARTVAEEHALRAGRFERLAGPWSRWRDAIRHCESRSDAKARSAGSTAGGLYQVTRGTWDGFEGFARAVDAPIEVQERFAADLFARRGLRPWAASKACWGPIVLRAAPYPA